MKKFIAMLTLLIGFNANAGLLTINLSASEVSVGESILVTISASDFEESALFGFDFNFDNSVMSYSESSLNSDLADGRIGDRNGLLVTAEDFGLNFNFATEDDSLMAAGNFVLASFNLIADATGSFDFSVSGLYDDWTWVDHAVAFSGASSVNVSASSIPEPTSAALLMLAGLAFVSSRRKAK